MTEKETEALLELQTRELSMPDGSRRSLTEFKFTWDDFDYLSKHSCFDSATIIRMAKSNGEDVGISFEESFSAAVTYLRRKYRESGMER